MLSFKSIKSSYLSRKIFGGAKFMRVPHQWLWGQNMLVGTWLVERTEPSDTFNYELSFKHCILQTVLHIFLLFIFAWNKIFCSINWAAFYIFLIWFKVPLGVTILKVLCFWCSFYKIIGNSNKASPPRNVHQYIFFT